MSEYIFAALRKNYVDAVAGHEYMLRVFINESDNKYRLLDESLLLSKLPHILTAPDILQIVTHFKSFCVNKI